jgi:hypothetical protein
VQNWVTDAWGNHRGRAEREKLVGIGGLGRSISFRPSLVLITTPKDAEMNQLRSQLSILYAGLKLCGVLVFPTDQISLLLLLL